MIHRSLHRSTRTGRRPIVPGLLLLLVLPLAGCGGYSIPIVAVDPGFGTARFVASDAVPSSAQPVAGADISLFRDPGELREELVGRIRTAGDGRANLEVKSFGAGWLEERWRVRVIAPGYENVEAFLTLPRSTDGQVLLIELGEGTSFTPPTDDPWEQYLEFRDR